MVATAVVVIVKAGLVGFKVGQAIQARAHLGLDEFTQGFQVLPVGAVVPSEEDGRLKAEGVGLADVIADVFEVLPGRHTG